MECLIFFIYFYICLGIRIKRKFVKYFMIMVEILNIICIVNKFGGWICIIVFLCYYVNLKVFFVEFWRRIGC